MKTIARFPIYPAARLLVDVPVGAEPLTVSLNVHTYYLHAMHDLPIDGFEKRAIAAYLNEQPINGDPGRYIGSCRQSGDARLWHFFDQGVDAV